MMVKKHGLLVMGVTVAAALGSTFAFDGDVMMKNNNHQAVKDAIIADDYDAFQNAVADTPMSDHIDTEEEFEVLVQMHELIKAGDKKGAQELAEELDLPNVGHKRHMKVKGHITEFKAHKEQFETLMEDEQSREKLMTMHEALQNGDKETAESIANELGLPIFEDNHKPFGDHDAHMDSIRAAVEANDYNTFQEAAANTPIANEIDTAEKFAQFVEFHKAMHDGNIETAKELAESLDLPQKKLNRHQHLFMHRGTYTK